MYLGCNSPNQLQEVLVAFHDFDYSSIPFAAYRSIGRLALRLKNYSALPLSHRSPVLLHNLQSLELDVDECGDVAISTFMARKYLQFDPQRILILKVRNFYNLSKDAFIDFLCFFRNTQFLQLEDDFNELSKEELTIIRNALPHLKGICIDSSDDVPEYQEQIIEAFDDQLESLEINQCDYQLQFLNSANLRNLSGLRLPTFASHATGRIVKRAKNLRALHMQIPYDVARERDREEHDVEELRESVMVLFAECTGLEYVEFVSQLHALHFLLKPLENALFCTKAIRRKALKIKIKINTGAVHCSHDMEISAYLRKIVCWLNLSDIEHFMLVLDADRLPEFEAELKEELNGLKLAEDVVVRADDEFLVVTNRNCTIDTFDTPSVIAKW